MRKASFLIIGPLLFALAAPVYASVIIKEGKSEVHVQTTTSAGDGGTTTTHIQTTVNGKTEVFDSSKSGTIDVHVTSDDNKQVIATVSGAAIAGPSAQPITDKKEKKEGIQIFFDNIKSFFKNIFHFF